MSTVPVITIDGPSGAGKGTTAALVARRLGFHLLDSGALYRILAWYAEQKGAALDDVPVLVSLAGQMEICFVAAEEGQHILCDGQDISGLIRTELVAAGASRVASQPLVREVLLQCQRDFAMVPGLIADGRDMGTEVFPDAPLKIFLTASAEERARRRYDQLKNNHPEVTLGGLLTEIKARDERDMQRQTAPLRPAADALLLDSTALSIEQVTDYILAQAAQRGLTG